MTINKHLLYLILATSACAVDPDESLELAEQEQLSELDPPQITLQQEGQTCIRDNPQLQCEPHLTCVYYDLLNGFGTCRSVWWWLWTTTDVPPPEEPILEDPALDVPSSEDPSADDPTVAVPAEQP